MKKILYTILSIASIIYIGFLIVDVVRATTNGLPHLGNFTKFFEFIVRFGGIGIIFCFSLLNFSGSPLKMVFFILFIVAVVIYVIVLAIPEPLANWFFPKESVAVYDPLNL